MAQPSIDDQVSCTILANVIRMAHLSWSLLFSQTLPVIAEDNRGIIHRLALAVSLHQLH